MVQSLITQIVALNDKSIQELRLIYEELFSSKPNSRSNKRHLIPKIGYRLQELTADRLSDESRKKLLHIARNPKTNSNASHLNVLPGTKLRRDWNGIAHEVEVLRDAKFEYQGQVFKSLSAIARKITGTQWNGHRFFGLRSAHANS